MARSKFKLIYLNKRFIRSIFLFKIGLKKIKKKIFTKNNFIPKTFLKKTFIIYKGLSWTKIKISPLMIGHKFGEFALTKKPFYFPIREKNKTKLYKR